MLSIRYRFALLATLAVVAVVLFRGTNEEKQILDQLEQIRGLTEVNAPEGALEQASKATRIGQFFSEQTTFDLSNAGYRTIDISDREELIRKILKGRATLSSLELALRDPRVTVEGKRAEVEFQGSALGSIRGEEGQFLDVHVLNVELKKEEGSWLVVGAQHIRDERNQPNGSISQP